MSTENIRPAEGRDAEAVAALWHAGWRDGHDGLLPEALTRHRTPEKFLERAKEAVDRTWVAEIGGAVAGFYMLKENELDQFYLAASARGTGLASRLIADAEARIAAAGYDTAWLACAIGNMRAARFYEKSGWRMAEIFTSKLPVPGGVVELDVWRYEKKLNSLD